MIMALTISKWILSTFVLTFAVQDFVSATTPVNLACNGQAKYKWINLVKPAVAGTRCQYTIKPYNKYVCQLKVEFSTNLGQPTIPTDIPLASPICTNSYLEIGKYKVCGVNNNQHLYLQFSSATSSSEIITVDPGSAINPTYTIKVTQIECPLNTRDSKQAKLIESRTFDTNLIAPVGCAQYFTETSGVFESINFNNGLGPYPARMSYAICFKRPAKSTTIQFQANFFKLSSNDATMIGDMCYDPIEATIGYASDYLFVPFSKILSTSISSFQYCGNILEGETLKSDMIGPYSIVFHAGQYLPPTAILQRGFRISYKTI